MAETEQDAELVRLAQAGDAKAFEALVVKCQRRVARHVARYLKAAGDVQDVVQETFIRAYRGLALVPGGQRLLQLALPHRHQCRALSPEAGAERHVAR